LRVWDENDSDESIEQITLEVELLLEFSSLHPQHFEVFLRLIERWYCGVRRIVIFICWDG
jgi:hypothetical protein